MVLLFCTQAFADYSSVVDYSECQVVAKTTNVAGAMGGAMVGGAVGSGIGRAVLGKKWGGLVGGLAGAATGGHVGQNIGASRTFSCVVKFRDTDNKTHVVETLGNQYHAQQRITVFEDSTGKIIVR